MCLPVFLWVLVFFLTFGMELLWCCLLFAPSGWCCSLSLLLVVFLPFERQLNGANELNQVAVKQSGPFFGGGVFLPPPIRWRCLFSPSPPFASRVEVFSLLLLFRWRCFPSLPFCEAVLSYLSPLQGGARSVAVNLLLLI